MDCLPGTLWVNKGRWNWRVKLPESNKRKNFPLRLYNQQQAIPEEKGKGLAESLAWRKWEELTRQKITKSHTGCITLEQVASQFLTWADTYYRHPDGSQTRERENCEIALRILRSHFGNEPIDNIAYYSLLDTRNEMEQSGLNRTTINQRVGIWKRFISWALENRLCSASTKSEWWAMSNLKRNRTTAPEGKPVLPISHLYVKRTLPFLSPMIKTMVLSQEVCGARPLEMCSMRLCDIERRQNIWIYRPQYHKTDYTGNIRVIVLGPRAQNILSLYIGKRNWKDDNDLFHFPGSKRPGRSYSQAIRFSIRAAQREGVKVDHWSPNQLRHACGTRIRRKFSAEAAQVILGHSSGTRITDRYTREAIETEIISKASKIMAALG